MDWLRTYEMSFQLRGNGRVGLEGKEESRRVRQNAGLGLAERWGLKLWRVFLRGQVAAEPRGGGRGGGRLMDLYQLLGADKEEGAGDSVGW